MYYIDAGVGCPHVGPVRKRYHRKDASSQRVIFISVEGGRKYINRHEENIFIFRPIAGKKYILIRRRRIDLCALCGSAVKSFCLSSLWRLWEFLQNIEHICMDISPLNRVKYTRNYFFLKGSVLGVIHKKYRGKGLRLPGAHPACH